MSYSAMRRKRFTAGVLAGAMALTVMPILGFTGVASADHPTLPPVADPIGEGNVCEDAPDNEPFIDVTEADPSYDEIVCLFQADITKGKTATTYVPNGDVERREMALFLKRTADTADANDTGDNITALPAGDGDVDDDFSDMELESAEVRLAVDQLNQAGIALGYEDGRYGPPDSLTRRQMAKFIVREYEFLTGEDAPAPQGDYFHDDEDEEAVSELALNTVAELGIFQGYGDLETGEPNGNVGPGDNLTRRQMANILLRLLEVLYEKNDISRLFAETGPDLVVDAEEDTVDAATYDITGTTEPGATVTVVIESTGDTVDATVADDGTFSAEVPLDQNADNEFTVTASADGATSDPVTVIIHERDLPPEAVAASDDDTIVVFTFNEDIDCATVDQVVVAGDTEDFDVTADTEQIATVACEGDTVTVTLDDALDAGESLTLVALSVDDSEAGNPGPSEDVTFTVTA